MTNNDPRRRYEREVRQLPEWLQAELEEQQATRRAQHIGLAMIAALVLASCVGAALAILKNAGVL